jgi:hypothetical protein
MEEINENNKSTVNIAVHIEGDKNGFVSKTAITKFKNALKSNPEINLNELTEKYIKHNFELVQVGKSNNEIKFIIRQKTEQQTHIRTDELKQKLRDKYFNHADKETKYSIGQEKSSEIIKDVITKLQEKCLTHRIIDITNILNSDTYVEYQKANYFTNIIMVAERKASNESVFIPRTNSDKSNIMVMYRGAYRTFNYELFNLVIDSILDIVK